MFIHRAPPLWGNAATAVDLAWGVFEWGRSQRGTRYLTSLLESRADPSEVDLLRNSSTRPFGEAPLFLVTNEMATVARHAATSMQDQTLLSTDLPSQEGALLLDGGYTHFRVEDDTAGAAAYSWATVTVPPDRSLGLAVSLWSDFQDPEDTLARAAREDAQAAGAPRLGLLHVAAWAFGTDVASPLVGDPSAQPALRTFIALLSMMRQRVAITSEGHLPRQAQRQLARQRRSAPELRVVTLRRAYAPIPASAESPHQVDWSRRWVVGGHWRQQWYPSIDNHRQIWIAPYVKGPGDKPLVLPDEVYKLRR